MKVLCAIDGSRYSRWALEALGCLQVFPGSALLLLHVVNVERFRVSAELNAATKEAMRHGLYLAETGGRKLLRRAKAAVSSQWSSVAVKTLRGDPAQTIIRTAVDQQCDLVVVGSRGLTEFRPFLLGSVSRRVIMGSPCSVLLVKKRIPVLKQIVVGVDGSKDARGAVEFLLTASYPKNVHITVMSVVPPLPIETSPESEALADVLEQVLGPLEKEARKVAEQATARMREAGMDASTTVAHGHIGRQIVELARSSKADLVVVGSRGLDGTAPYLMGSVSDAVVKYAPCSVLIYRR